MQSVRIMFALPRMWWYSSKSPSANGYFSAQMATQSSLHDSGRVRQGPSVNLAVDKLFRSSSTLEKSGISARWSTKLGNSSMINVVVHKNPRNSTCIPSLVAHKNSRSSSIFSPAAHQTSLQNANLLTNSTRLPCRPKPSKAMSKAMSKASDQGMKHKYEITITIT